MPLFFNTLLKQYNIEPKDVRLLRHKDHRASKGKSIYELWRDTPAIFDLYQSTQSFHNRKRLSSQYWASFVADHHNETIFAGLYSVKYTGILDHDTPKPHIDNEIERAGSCDKFDIKLVAELSEFIGRLIIDWGEGALAWAQYADRNEKFVIELKQAKQEDPFPGYTNFIESLSAISALPISWVTALKSVRGVYLLTCPKTKEVYVGSATGEDGFWGRWQSYVQSGHGGNAGLKSRLLSDYQISILEIAGTLSSPKDILEAEGRWQLKLQSNVMGLNRNLASRIK